MPYPAPHPRREGRIVVSHDDPAQLASITSLLRSAGFCVFEAQDELACCGIALLISRLQLIIVNNEWTEQSRLIRHLLREIPSVTVLQLATHPVQQAQSSRVATLQQPFTEHQLLDAVNQLMSEVAMGAELM